MWVLCQVLLAYQLVIIARIILEYIPVSSEHPLAGVRRVLRMLTEPLLAPLRAIIPSVRMGSVALDLSPLILLVVINLVAAAIC